MRKLIILSLAGGLLSACAVSPENFKIGTKNGKDYYELDVVNKQQVNFWGNKFCPQGFELVSYKYDGVVHSTISPVSTTWYKATIACPVQ